MHRKVIGPVVACALLALLAWLVYAVIRPFLVALVWGAAMTVVTFPVYDRLRRKLGGHSGLAATVMVVGTLLVLVAPAVTLIAALSGQAADVYPKIEEIVTRDEPLQPVYNKLDSYKDHPMLGGAAAWARSLLPAPGNLRTALPGGLKKLIEAVTGVLTAALSNMLVFLVNLILTLAALGTFYTRGEPLLKEVTSLLPLPAGRGRELMVRLGVVTRAVVKGVALTCVAQGALGGVGWWVVGLPSPLLFGTVMAFGSLVPVVGTTVVWLPGALYLIFTGKTVAGIGLILWGAVVVGSADNVLRPLLTGGNTGIPMPLLLVGILGGLFSFGMTGLILGPLVLAVLLFVLEEHHRAVAGEEAAPPPTV